MTDPVRSPALSSSSASSSPLSGFSDASSGAADTSGASTAASSTNGANSPWLYDETGAFVSKPLAASASQQHATMAAAVATSPPPAERQWASAHRASSRDPLAPPPLGTSASSGAVITGPPSANSSSAPSPDPNMLSPQANRRPHSFYLPLDGSSTAPPSPSHAWPFAQGPGHFLSQPPDTPLLKSPSQLNPVFAIPSVSELAGGGRRGVAEPYHDPQEFRYGAGLPEAYKASPPVGYDPETGGFSSPALGYGSTAVTGRAEVAEKQQARRYHEPRPFYRSPSGSISQSYSRRGSPSGSPAAVDDSFSGTTPRGGSLGYGLPPIQKPSMFRQQLNSSTAWLVYYFAFNLGLTIYNKRVLQGFPFPWTLTGVHTLCGAIGSQTALHYHFFVPGRLSRREGATLVAFSVLYTVNIAISNVSLHLVTVPFHQVVRATTPLFTIVLSILWFRRTYSSQTYLSLLIVVLGVGLSTYGDYGWTSWGLFLTLLGTLLAALKTVVTNALLVGRLKLHPLDLLLRMSPLAFVQCVLVSWWSGEMARVREYGATKMTAEKATALFINGVIAFGLNVVSFTANKKTSALTMTVAANVKQVLTIVLAVWAFDLVIGPLNFSGITLTLLGGAWYAKAELDQRRKASKAKASPSLLNGAAMAPPPPGASNGLGVAGAGPHKFG